MTTVIIEDILSQINYKKTDEDVRNFVMEATTNVVTSNNMMIALVEDWYDLKLTFDSDGKILSYQCGVCDFNIFSSKINQEDIADLVINKSFNQILHVSLMSELALNKPLADEARGMAIEFEWIYSSANSLQGARDLGESDIFWKDTLEQVEASAAVVVGSGSDDKERVLCSINVLNSIYTLVMRQLAKQSKMASNDAANVINRSALFDLDARLLTSGKLTQGLQIITEVITQSCDWARGELWLVGNANIGNHDEISIGLARSVCKFQYACLGNGRQFVDKDCSSNTVLEDPRTPIDFGRTIVGRAAMSGQIEWADNIKIDTWALRSKDDVDLCSMGTAVGIPIHHHNQLLAVIVVFRERPTSRVSMIDLLRYSLSEIAKSVSSFLGAMEVKLLNDAWSHVMAKSRDIHGAVIIDTWHVKDNSVEPTVGHLRLKYLDRGARRLLHSEDVLTVRVGINDISTDEGCSLFLNEIAPIVISNQAWAGEFSFVSFEGFEVVTCSVNFFALAGEDVNSRERTIGFSGFDIRDEKRLTAVAKQEEQEVSRMKAMIDGAPDAMYFFDLITGSIPFINSMCLEMTGLKDQKNLYIEMIHPESDILIIKNEIATKLLAKDRWNGTLHLLTANSQVFVEASCFRLNVSETNLSLAGMICRDVSEKRILEERKRVSEAEREKLFALVNSTSDCLSIINLSNKTVVFMNKSGYDILGVTTNFAASPKPIAELFTDESVQTLKGELESNCSRMGTWSGPLAFVHQESKELIPTESSAFIMRIGQVAELLIGIISRDVREFLAKIEALKLRELAMENTADAITICDNSQTNLPLIYANEAFLTITGYSRYELVGKNLRMLQGQQTDPECIKKIREAIKNAEEISIELKNYRKDGKMFWNQLTLTPVLAKNAPKVKLGGGRDVEFVTHWVGVIRDVTAQKDSLSDELQMMDAALHALPSGTALVDSACHILYSNKAFCSMVGWTIEEIEERVLTLSELFRGNPESMALLKQAAGNLTEVKVDITYRLDPTRRRKVASGASGGSFGGNVRPEEEKFSLSLTVINNDKANSVLMTTLVEA